MEIPLHLTLDEVQLAISGVAQLRQKAFAAGEPDLWERASRLLSMLEVKEKEMKRGYA